MSLIIVAYDYLCLFAYSCVFLMVAEGQGSYRMSNMTIPPTKKFLLQEFRLGFGDVNLAVLLNQYEANLRMEIAI